MNDHAEGFDFLGRTIAMVDECGGVKLRRRRREEEKSVNKNVEKSRTRGDLSQK